MVIEANDGHSESIPYSVITSVLMVVIPDEKLFSQVEAFFGKWTKSLKRQLYDMDILNQRFSCRYEVLVLPKHYGTLNSEYLSNEKLSRILAKCKEIKKVYYLHFSGLGKPWQHAEDIKDYLDSYEMQIQPFMARWLSLFSILCHA